VSPDPCLLGPSRYQMGKSARCFGWEGNYDTGQERPLVHPHTPIYNVILKRKYDTVHHTGLESSGGSLL
jgi:hypothetical protein